MEYKITKQQFKYYQTCGDYYADILGLHEWEIVYELKDIGSGSLAACSADRCSRLAILLLSPTWIDQKPTNAEIKGSAAHEVLELLLWDMQFLASERSYNEDTYEAARHAVIRRLERLMP